MNNLLALILCFAFLEVSASSDKVLTMVYKPVAKAPYIMEYPDNSGLYLDMLKEATEKIGFRLKVIRVPKARSYKMLKDGTADLYASGEYNPQRAKFLYYTPNGLHRSEIHQCITAPGIPELNSIQEVKKHHLVWHIERGSSWVLRAKRLNVKATQIISINIETAIKFFRSERPAVFTILKKDIDKYISTYPRAGIDFKVHRNCKFVKDKELYTGFSRSSKYYAEVKNENYDKQIALGAKNLPYRPSTTSVASKLSASLQEMISSGGIDKLKKKYNIK